MVDSPNAAWVNFHGLELFRKILKDKRRLKIFYCGYDNVVKAEICDIRYDCADTVFRISAPITLRLLRLPSDVTFSSNEAHECIGARRHADISERRLVDPNPGGMLAQLC